jgi:hypothetical protein
MSEMSKLNIKTFKLPFNIIHLFALSCGYSFGFYSKYIDATDEIENFLNLYKIQNDNFFELKKYNYSGWNPIIYFELKNKTLLTA